MSSPRPNELTAEEESILEKNLVWVFGSARGGTTWLALQLMSYQTNSQMSADSKFINNTSFIKLFDKTEQVRLLFFFFLAERKTFTWK